MTKPLPPQDWAAAMRARTMEVVTAPMPEAAIIELERTRFPSGQDLDGVLFVLPLGVAPILEKGGSGFRIDRDPDEGPSEFSLAQMKLFLDRPTSW